MPLADLPDWLPAWCLEHLGNEPVDVLFQLQRMSTVFGLRLADGTDVVVKSRVGDGRAVSCVTAQTQLAERGFPCPRPLTPAVRAGASTVHAEEFRPGGEVLHEDSPEVALRYADVFARLMAELVEVTVAPPLPNPRWVRWDHTNSGVWPAIQFLDDRDQSAVPTYVVDAADRARKRRHCRHKQPNGSTEQKPSALSNARLAVAGNHCCRRSRCHCGRSTRSLGCRP